VLVQLIVVDCMVVLVVRKFNLLFAQLNLRIVAFFLLVVLLATHKRNWLVQPINLLLHIRLQALPLFNYIALRELPEHLLHGEAKDWISIA
jgi:hypothetical protein